jgi:hypothetical protein
MPAIELYIDDRHPVSVHTLAMAAAEIIDRHAKQMVPQQGRHDPTRSTTTRGSRFFCARERPTGIEIAWQHAPSVL